MPSRADPRERFSPACWLATGGVRGSRNRWFSRPNVNEGCPAGWCLESHPGYKTMVRSFPRHLGALVASLLCPAILPAEGPPAAPDRIRQVIENVEANEKLYQNIEVVLRLNYRLDEKVGPVMDKLKTRQESVLRSVSQKGLFYLKSGGSEALVSGDAFEANTVKGYDGGKTRWVQRNGKEVAGRMDMTAAANIVSGRQEDCGVFVAHTWLLSRAPMCFPLSLWLRGDPALSAHPQAGFYGKNALKKEASFEKEEEVDGLRCVKLRSETRLRAGDQRIIGVRDLWLAIDRNYLPVKTEFYEPRISMELPGESGHAWDFREIAPGVWLPFERKVTVYDSDKLRDEKKQVFRNADEARLELAKLDPDYDISLFRDIPIPAGATVYEIQDGKIVNKYVQERDEGPKQPSSPGRRMAWIILLAATLLLLLALGILAYYRRRARRTAPA